MLGDHSLPLYLQVTTTRAITLATPRYVGRNLAHRRTSKDTKACNSRGLRMLTFQAASNQEQRILPSSPPTPTHLLLLYVLTYFLTHFLTHFLTSLLVHVMQVVQVVQVA